MVGLSHGVAIFGGGDVCLGYLGFFLCTREGIFCFENWFRRDRKREKGELGGQEL